MSLGISGCGNNNSSGSARSFVETFSATLTLTSDDWYTSSKQFRGKYNLVYQASSVLDISNAFYNDYIALAFTPNAPYKCKLVKMFVNVMHNGGNGSVQYALRTFELSNETVNGNNISAVVNSKILGDITIPSISPNLHSIDLDNSQMVLDYEIKKNALFQMYFRRVGSTTSVPLQKLNISCLFEEILE